MKVHSWMRREWRWVRKRATWGLAVSFFYVGLAVLAGVWMISNDLKYEKTVTEDVSRMPPDMRTVTALGTGEVTMVIRSLYECGETTEIAQTIQASEVSRWKNMHPNVMLMGRTKDTMVWQQQVADLAPQCKINGFFSIDSQGRLSLFQGPPDNGKIIRTFFQIEVERLESQLPKKAIAELFRGIRIRNVNEYHSVISTFRPFSASP